MARSNTSASPNPESPPFGVPTPSSPSLRSKASTPSSTEVRRQRSCRRSKNSASVSCASALSVPASLPGTSLTPRNSTRRISAMSCPDLRRRREKKPGAGGSASQSRNAKGRHSRPDRACLVTCSETVDRADSRHDQAPSARGKYRINSGRTHFGRPGRDRGGSVEDSGDG